MVQGLECAEFLNAKSRRAGVEKPLGVVKHFPEALEKIAPEHSDGTGAGHDPKATGAVYVIDVLVSNPRSDIR